MNEIISIVVPIYNSEKTIEKCIVSLIKQSYKELEIILVNDGSTDNSLGICRECSKIDKRIKVLDKDNAGVSSARNTGIENATGKYLMFCDSDDWVNANWCQHFIENYVDNHLVMCGISFNNIDSNTVVKSMADINEKIRLVHKKDFFKLYEYGFNSPCNKIYDLDCINQNKIRFNTKIDLGEDVLFNLEYLSNINSNIIVINECLYNYEVSSKDSLSRKIFDNYFEQVIYVYNNIQNYMDKFELEDMIQKRDFHTVYFYHFINGLSINWTSKTTKIINKIRTNNKVVMSKEYSKCVNYANISKLNIFCNLLCMRSYVAIYLCVRLYNALKIKRWR